MKTPDEIKKGLEVCKRHHCDKGCTFAGAKLCYVTLHKDALAYIQQLESLLTSAVDALGVAERERDAAVEDLKECGFCVDCMHNDLTAEQEPCRSCLKRMHEKPNWQWRGPCPENTKEDMPHDP